MDQITIPLSDNELDWLDDFLLYRVDEDEADARAGEADEGILDVSDWMALTAVASGPNTVVPSTWLPAVWGDYEPEWESPAEFEKVFNLLVRHMNSIVSMLISSPQEFEPMFLYREVDGKEIQIVDEWCVGYLRGVALDETSWHADELATQLGVIQLFGAEAGWEKLGQMNSDEMEKQKALLPAAVRKIHACWYKRRGESQTIRRDSPKLGRNDVCPCGSGKKYKKCCGAAPTLH
jgi:uncharacterized protein